MKIKRHLFYRRKLKRLIGYMISFISLLVLWPLMIIIAILIKCESNGSILFKQERLGKNHRVFTVYKFRTMVSNAYQMGGAKSYDGDPRITKVGSFLRKTSLDELPQLVNILKGDMCIIGPRPILEEEFAPYYDVDLYDKRFKAKPGLFCTVDVNYRAIASRDFQFEMDSEYVDNISFLLDVCIFLKIIMTVIKRENVYKNPIVKVIRTSKVNRTSKMHRK